MAREGADVSIVYLPQEQEDADFTKDAIERGGGSCLLLPKDLRNHNVCGQVVQDHVNKCIESLLSRWANLLTWAIDTATSTF